MRLLNLRKFVNWSGEGGCVAVLRMAAPLILSTGAASIQMFIDRVFLMWYSKDAMSANLQAGITHFTIFALFLGVAAYVNTFVAQYTGASRPLRVGKAVWQGIYFALAAGVLMLGLIPLARPLFNWVGHPSPLREQEIIYFKILCFGAVPSLVATAVSSFFTGRGKMAVVMWVSFAAAALNIVLDYALIFGHWYMPRLGIAGAAWATVSAHVMTAIVFLALFFRAENRRNYAALAGYKPERDLFGRLLRYGFPSGMHIMLDVLSFTLFVTFVGRIDDVSLAATAIAFQINGLAFIPMLGFSTAVNTMVGQALGDNNPALAERSTFSAASLTLGYMTALAVGYWFLPELFMYPFAAQADAAEFARLRPVVIMLIRFVAFYCLFDTGNIIFTAALRGAGDTRFVMILSVSLSWVMFIIPTYICVRMGLGLKVVWSFLTVYVCVLALVFLARFLGGKWKSMRVIEHIPPVVTAHRPDVPMIEA